MVLLAVADIAEAQQPKKIPRIGLLLALSASFYSARVEAFRQGLRELGYVEGNNFVIEYRYAEGKLDRLPDLAVELVHLKVDLIVTASNDGVLAAKKATRTIPIVFATAADPVGSGLVPRFGATGRQHHRDQQRCSRFIWKKVRAAQGILPQSYPGGFSMQIQWA